MSNYTQRKILKDVFLYQTKFNIMNDKDYFISKIEKGIKLDNNQNYVSNIKGKMTDWLFFNEDQRLMNYILQAGKEIQKFYKLFNAKIVSAWGIKINKKDYTAIHNHDESYCSGVLYLNKTETSINFPELDLIIKPEEGTFLMFSAILNHGTEEHKEDITKYAIAFNLNRLRF